MGSPPDRPGGMRDIELDDAFWRDALGGLAAGSRASALSSRHSAIAELLSELEADAARDALLVGMRLAGGDRNGRLLAFIAAAFLARAGVRTLLVDLSPDLRWLEHLLGADFKEGIVDHIHYQVPLERCVRATALEPLAVLSGGATFLAGSPLDDAPALRGAVDRLRQRYRAVVVVLPLSESGTDPAGLTGLCDALITVEGPESTAAVVGRERAVVRLAGDPQAAWDLARLTHRFLGPLPGLLARPAPRAPAAPQFPADAWPEEPRPPAAMPAGASAAEEVAFLSAFERPPAEEREAIPGPFRIEDVEDDVPVEAAGTEPWRPARERRGGRRAAALLGVLLLVLLSGWVARRHVIPLLTGGGGPAVGEVATITGLPEEELRLNPDDGGTVVPLVPEDPDEAAAGEAGEDPAELAEEEAEEPEEEPAEEPGRPAPFSVHVGSFQDQRAGLAVVSELQERGHEAYLAPVDLADRGRWFRVYVGAFSDSTEAGAAQAELLRAEVVQDAIVRPTPWTYELGTFATREEAERRRRELRRQGITAYLAGSGPVRLYTGAYATREEAAALAPVLDDRAGTATLTRRDL